MRRFCLTTGFLFFTAGAMMAQYEIKKTSEKAVFPWPKGIRCAISLVFDDARLSQIDKGIPLLNTYGVKATFYVLPELVLQRMDDWKEVVVKGHEIGSHTMTHPCTGNYAFSRDNALEEYDLKRMAEDIDKANAFILAELDVEAKSFAYPCGQKFVGRGKNVKSYVPLVADRFLTGRGWLDEDANDPWICDFAQLLCMECDGKSFEQLKELIDKTTAQGGWLILAGHEMAESGDQTTLLSSLDAVCRYAQDKSNGIWLDTVEHIAMFIKDNR